MCNAFGSRLSINLQIYLLYHVNIQVPFCCCNDAYIKMIKFAFKVWRGFFLYMSMMRHSNFKCQHFIGLTPIKILAQPYTPVNI